MPNVSSQRRTETMKRSPTSSWISERLNRLRPCLENLYNRQFTRGLVQDLVRQVFAAVSSPKRPDKEQLLAAYRSLGHLIIAGPAPRHMVVANVTRLLANWNFIQEGMEIPLWDGSRTTADMVVISFQYPHPTRTKCLLLVKLKTGLGAGIIICAQVYTEAVAQFLQRSSGTAKYYCAVEEVAGMEVRASVSMNPDNTLRIHEWDCTERQKEHNRDLAKRREDPAKCPNAPSPCNACPKTVKECPLAVWMKRPPQKTD